MNQSTASRPGDKPEKPRPDFPLFAHATRRWAKKIRGKLHYFGPWSDPEGARNKYLAEKDYLLAGRKPPESTDGNTVRDLLNRFLTGKQNLLDSGEIAQRTFDDYHATCERLAASFGRTRALDDLRPEDFEKRRAGLAKNLGPVALGNEIQRVRGVFKYGFEAGLVERPVRFGPGFKRPSRKVLRKHRNARGPRMFEAEELRKLLAASGPQMKAMVLLGVNCGFGNADCGTLPLSALDLDGGWVNYPRPKTGITRRCPLWPETVAALRQAIAKRPGPKDPADADLVFITKYGKRWFKGTPDNPLSHETAKLLKELGIHRPRLNFYALRHTFETIGGESRDQAAVDHIMGHVRDDMASVYRERISDDRLRAVTELVRAWLFPPEAKAKGKQRRSA